MTIDSYSEARAKCRALTNGNVLRKMYVTYERRKVHVCKTLSSKPDGLRLIFLIVESTDTFKNIEIFIPLINYVRKATRLLVKIRKKIRQHFCIL